MRRSLLLVPITWALPALLPRARARPLIPPALMGPASQLLATLIRNGRENAIAAGVKPVPSGIYRRLLGFFPDAILRKARYLSGQTDSIGIPGMPLTYGHAAAMTLGEVILFREDEKAGEDTRLWAHELTHVMQYERWGIDDFAARYLEDRKAVEKEARDNAERYVRWNQRVRH